ncbi:DUF4246 domain-containing protein [Yasminevirus sp. GU-2018]|uniref:DUF4246 domain-containing protein n=1 Tax=Yasminevirus sp. GU-2018 TaxID=2420051 RepID=A0A5K0U6Z7_9VIRU|nr:DUF4246 domain-containing protein [Yasminevirus sp. GU-2018]
MLGRDHNQNHRVVFKHPFTLDSELYNGYALTLLEKGMLALKNMIVLKPDWKRKVFDNLIVNKWRAESADNLTTKGFNSMIEELRVCANASIIIKTPLRTSIIDISPVDGAYQSDDLVKDSLQTDLIFYGECLKFPTKYNLNGVGKLDWHPGSNNQVLDLVHPSLYCATNGVTKMKNGRSVDFPKNPGNYLSTKYHWLPTDVEISKEGDAKFKSYINNLHPGENARLYRVLERVLSCFVPMFDVVLSDSLSPKVSRVGDHNLAIDFDHNSYADRLKNRSRYTIKGKTVQVIVKIAHIILTPENPEYKGGVWHVEGMANEQIVASGIYYYDQNNISESKLHFRMAGYDPSYEQDDRVGVRREYGLKDEDRINNYLGYISTTNRRAIAFPNLFQHKVDNFSLEDRTKPGYRKILVFFLVDPNTKITSTSDVDPQQSHWYDGDNVKGKMTFEQAVEHRKALMEERKYAVDALTELVFEREFSLCEH